MGTVRLFIPEVESFTKEGSKKAALTKVTAEQLMDNKTKGRIQERIDRYNKLVEKLNDLMDKNPNKKSLKTKVMDKVGLEDKNSINYLQKALKEQGFLIIMDLSRMIDNKLRQKSPAKKIKLSSKHLEKIRQFVRDNIFEHYNNTFNELGDLSSEERKDKLALDLGEVNVPDVTMNIEDGEITKAQDLGSFLNSKSNDKKEKEEKIEKTEENKDSKEEEVEEVKVEEEKAEVKEEAKFDESQVDNNIKQDIIYLSESFEDLDREEFVDVLRRIEKYKRENKINLSSFVEENLKPKFIEFLYKNKVPFGNKRDPKVVENLNKIINMCVLLDVNYDELYKESAKEVSIMKYMDDFNASYNEAELAWAMEIAKKPANPEVVEVPEETVVEETNEEVVEEQVDEDQYLLDKMQEPMVENYIPIKYQPKILFDTYGRVDFQLYTLDEEELTRELEKINSKFITWLLVNKELSEKDIIFEINDNIKLMNKEEGRNLAYVNEVPRDYVIHSRNTNEFFINRPEEYERIRDISNELERRERIAKERDIRLKKEKEKAEKARNYKFLIDALTDVLGNENTKIFETKTFDEKVNLLNTYERILPSTFNKAKDLAEKRKKESLEKKQELKKEVPVKKEEPKKEERQKIEGIREPQFIKRRVRTQKRAS